MTLPPPPGPSTPCESMLWLTGLSVEFFKVSSTVPAGGATVVEFKTQVPGAYLLVDHSLGRLQKGALGFLEVEGPPNPAVFQSIKAGSVASGGRFSADRRSLGLHCCTWRSPTPGQAARRPFFALPIKGRH